MRFVSERLIEIDRELSDLDKFALDFIQILKKYTKYVVISGYVSILLGRARSSEDVDIIIPRIDFAKFELLLNELVQKGFYCLNAENAKNIYDYLKSNLAARFAKENTAIPNIEMKFAKNKFDSIALTDTIIVKLGKEEIITSHLELQVAFKETVLKSPKDMEDAKHIRNVAEGHLDKELIDKYEAMLREFY